MGSRKLTFGLIKAQPLRKFLLTFKLVRFSIEMHLMSWITSLDSVLMNPRLSPPWGYLLTPRLFFREKHEENIRIC